MIKFDRLGNLALTLALLMAVAPCGLAADGTWRSFFGFGGDEPSAEEASTTQAVLGDTMAEPAQSESDKADWMVSSPFGNVTWPEIKMPKFEFNPPWGSREGGEGGEGGWFATPIAKARTTATSAMERTRSAWNGTIDRMKFVLPGGNLDDGRTPPQLAGSEQPGIIERMLGSKQPETETDDVVEMMAQERAATLR